MKHAYRKLDEVVLVAYVWDPDISDEELLERLLEWNLERAEKEYIPPFAFAVVYAGLGEKDRGLEWLERGIAERDIFLPENFFDPLLDPLRQEPEFAEIESAMGLRRTN